MRRIFCKKMGETLHSVRMRCKFKVWWHSSFLITFACGSSSSSTNLKNVVIPPEKKKKPDLLLLDFIQHLGCVNSYLILG